MVLILTRSLALASKKLGLFLWGIYPFTSPKATPPSSALSFLVQQDLH